MLVCVALSNIQTYHLWAKDLSSWSNRIIYYVLRSYIICSRLLVRFVEPRELWTGLGGQTTRHFSCLPVFQLDHNWAWTRAKDIEYFAGVKLGPGTVYGAITRLEERGLIEPLEAQNRRRPYRITKAGIQALASAVTEMHQLAEIGASRLGFVLEPST